MAPRALNHLRGASIQLEDGQVKELDRVSAKMKKSRSQLMREIVADWLASRAAEKGGSIQ